MFSLNLSNLALKLVDAQEPAAATTTAAFSQAAHH
jgi:hypothetical protein